MPIGSSDAGRGKLTEIERLKGEIVKRDEAIVKLEGDKRSLIAANRQNAMFREIAEGALANVRTRWARAAEKALAGDNRYLTRLLHAERNPPRIVGSSDAGRAALSAVEEERP